MLFLREKYRFVLLSCGYRVVIKKPAMYVQPINFAGDRIFDRDLGLFDLWPPDPIRSFFYRGVIVSNTNKEPVVSLLSIVHMAF